ncbi:tetratricopeptide repeat protein, partial [Myxococcota bacterium]|nr:tetratricopeptide repeat protein [Myxococcota bacterium]
MEKQERDRLLQIARQSAERGERHRARVILARLAREDPQDVPVLDLLGFVLFFLGRYQEGLDACERALAIRPDHPYAHKGRGLHLAAIGRLDEGLIALRRAIELRPDWLDPRWDLCVTLIGAARCEEARAAMDEINARFPEAAPRLA